MPPVPRKKPPAGMQAAMSGGVSGSMGGQGMMGNEPVQREARKAYAPEPVQLEKAILNDLKKKVDTEFSQAMLESMVADEENEKLRDLITCEPEVESMQKIVNEKAKSL